MLKQTTTVLFKTSFLKCSESYLADAPSILKNLRYAFRRQIFAVFSVNFLNVLTAGF